MRTHGAFSQQGTSFFDGWDFQNSPDDTTHGVAMYIDRDTAVSLNLLTDCNEDVCILTWISSKLPTSLRSTMPGMQLCE